MEQKSVGSAVDISDFRNHGTAVRGKRVEQPDGSADSATGADDALDDAVDRARGRFYQLFPLENMYVRYGNVLAWDSGLFRTGKQEISGSERDPSKIGQNERRCRIALRSTGRNIAGL